MDIGQEALVGSPRALSLAKRLATISLLGGALTLLLLVSYARSPTGWTYLGAQVAASVALVSLAGAGTLGLYSVWAAHPKFRRTLLLAGGITLIVFVSHIYTIEDPPTYTVHSAVGSSVAAFSDPNSNVKVVPMLAGNVLSLVVTDTGQNAISGLSVTFGGTRLQDSGFNPMPSPNNPLVPPSASSLGYAGESRGTWVVNTSGGTAIKVDYTELTCYHLPSSGDNRGVFGCIMDESFYVPSAQAILSGQQCAQYAPNCNLEHPALAKALMAGGMAVFGLSGFGWRLPNVILGTLSVFLLFTLVMLLTRNHRLALVSMILFATDTMFFVHSGIGVIDVPAVFFSLLGFVVYFWRSHYWKVDNYVAAGLSLGLGALSKETAFLSMIAIVAYELIFGEGSARTSLARIIKTSVPALLIFIVGIQIFDTLYTSATQPWFYQQLEFMVSYGSSLSARVLACQPTTGYWCKFANDPGGPPILPMDWLLYYAPVVYLSVSSPVGNFVSVGYYGITNTVVVWLVFAWVPVLLYRLYGGWRRGVALGPDDKLGAFLIVWFAIDYLPYILLFYLGRVTYPFYLLPAVPALAIGAAYFVTRYWFPSKMTIIYILAAAAIFVLFYPDKDFMPAALRVFLGR